MNIFKAFAISFSLYSKIPMPQFNWDDEDMKYSLIFFPFVGAVILGVDYALYYLGNKLSLSDMILGLLCMAVPLVITGGFHVDGFMDVEDALKSYSLPEKKLEILKDPHIGAFAVIRFITLGIIYLAAFMILISRGDEPVFLIYGIGFIMARALSGISVLKLRSAKKDGMLKRESEVRGPVVLILLILEMILCIAMSCYLDLMAGLVELVGAVIMFMVYRHKSYKNFNGVTGDTAGYYLVCQETLWVVLLAVILLI